MEMLDLEERDQIEPLIGIVTQKLIELDTRIRTAEDELHGDIDE
jgi:hypothetical protein